MGRFIFHLFGFVIFPAFGFLLGMGMSYVVQNEDSSSYIFEPIVPSVFAAFMFLIYFVGIIRGKPF